MLDWNALTGLDWFIIVVLSVSMLISLWRGFVREALSLAGWFAAFVVAHALGDEMAALLGNWIANSTGSYIAAYALLFVATLILAAVLKSLAAQLLKATGLSIVDRLLGTVFGFARGVIILLVMLYVVRALVPPQELQWMGQSQLLPHLDMLGRWAQELLSNTGVPVLNQS